MALDEEDLNRLRLELHARVDQLFTNTASGLQLEIGALQFAGQLINAAQDWIDLQVGRDISNAANKDGVEALRLGAEERRRVKAAIFKVDGETPETTARTGLKGASVLAGQLAAFSNDPYLYHIAIALKDHQFGQVHPWLVVPSPAVHPPEKAHSVLVLRGVAFTAIEYLVASGAYAKKTEAEAAVLACLSIEKNGLDRWRKQQNKDRRSDFQLCLRTASLTGRGVKPFRIDASRDSASKSYVDYNDQWHGLGAVKQCAAYLELIGADKGKKT